MLVPISLQQRVSAASLIVEGKVLAQSSFWNQQHNMIYTTNRVEVLQVLKGNTVVQIDIINEGGTVDNISIVHSPSLQLSGNQYGIFFCQPSSVVNGAYSVYSSLQGFIQYDLKDNTATEPFQKYESILSSIDAVKNSTQQPSFSIHHDEALEAAIHFHTASKTTSGIAVKSFSPATISGGTNSFLTIKGSGFGEEQANGYVLFSNANDGGQSFVQPTAPHYLFWNDTMIVLRMPSTVMSNNGCAGTGNIKVVNDSNQTATSSNVLTVNYTYSNFEYNSFPYRSDLVNLNGIGGITFQLNTLFQQNTAASDAFVRGMNAWCETGMNWNISPATTTVNSIVQDGINVIRFDVGNEMPAGLLGKTISYYTGKGQAGSAFDWYVSEIDMMFDDAANWNFDLHTIGSAQYDFQSVVTHELGHVIQLNHVINPTDMMHFSIDKGVKKLAPSFDDIVGARYIIHQSLTTNANGPQPMRPLACDLPVELLSFSGIVYANRSVALRWEAYEGLTISRYELTRSTDNFHFTLVDTLHALNFSEPTTYQKTDTLIKDTVYYRLLCIKRDSSIAYSSSILVNNTNDNNELLLYPNPATTDIIISAKAALIEQLEVTLFNTDGRIQLHQSFNAYTGFQDLRIPVIQLPAGFYLYEVKLNGIVYRGKFGKE
jgi:hypothetical protein